MASPLPTSERVVGHDRILTDTRLIGDFNDAMAAAAPFECAPHVAAAVSGGADSMALAILASEWARARGGRLLALVVDHRLRPESTAEAVQTVSRLTTRGVTARLITLTGLAKGPALAERARIARYGALADACAESNILHLLLGHHACDQAETMMIRVMSGSGGRGLAGMSRVVEARSLRILRPLLTITPSWLRTFLQVRGIPWVEDLSNLDPKASRVRFRQLFAARSGNAEGLRSLMDAARSAGLARFATDNALAAVFANRVIVRPEGFALLSPGPIAPEALAGLLRMIAGAPFAPSIDRIAALAANMKPQTINGVRVMRAGRLHDGWLLVREETALGPPVPALDGALWDGRFRLRIPRKLPDGTMLGALGDAAVGVRGQSGLPAAVLRVMPGLWRCNVLVDVPQLLYPAAVRCAEGCRLVFDPPQPLAGAPFCPA